MARGERGAVTLGDVQRLRAGELTKRRCHLASSLSDLLLDRRASASSPSRIIAVGHLRIIAVSQSGEAPARAWGV